MKLWTQSLLYTALLLIINGCGGATPKPKEEVTVDTTLPVIQLTKSGIIKDMNSLAFEWKSFTDPRVKGIYIYKSEPTADGNMSEINYYKTIENRFSTHFVDNEVSPDTRYRYLFKTFSDDAQGTPSKIFLVNSLPVLSSVTWIYSVTGMPRTAKLLWRPHVDRKVKSYIIERRTLKNNEWEEIAELQGRLNAEYIDTDLKDNFVYMYRVRVRTFDGIISTPSQIVKVVTKPLPKGIQHIQATKNLPKKIKITWEKSTTKDFALYHLYRSTSIDGSYKLIATLHNPVFVDKIEEDGVSYFYRVSEVDKDGLESKHDKISIQGMTLPKPPAPSLVKANLVDNNRIEIRWKSNNPRVTSFKIIKTKRQGWFDAQTEEIDDIRQTEFVDTNITPETSYKYIVYAIDKNGIVSEPSLEVELQTQTLESVPVEINKKKAEPVEEKEASTPQSDVVSPTSDLDLNGL